jgi:hypothetical protein
MEFFMEEYLVGITFTDKDNNLIEQYQTHGTIKSIQDHTITILRNDNSLYHIPFDTDAIYKAEPGEYKEKSTGIVVVNPDYITTWTVSNTLDRDTIEKDKTIGFIEE